MKKWCLMCLFPLLTACGVEQINEGNRGLEVNWGKVVGEALPPGLYFYNPFSSSILELNVREEKVEGKRVEAFTFDNQKAFLDFAVTYYPKPESIKSLYTQLGSDWANKLIPQAVLGAMKDSIGKVRQDSLVEKRQQMADAAKDAIQTALRERGIVITRFDFTNLNFDPDYEKAVEAKVTAIQNAAAEKNRSVQIEELARQKIRTAQADAEAMRIQTAALSQSAALVEYERVKKWNGEVPNVLISGGGATPIIDMSGLVKGRKQ